MLQTETGLDADSTGVKAALDLHRQGQRIRTLSCRSTALACEHSSVHAEAPSSVSTDWSVWITTVRKFRVNDGARLLMQWLHLPFSAPIRKQWLQISDIHVYLQLQHQSVMVWNSRCFIKLIWLIPWVYSWNQPTTAGQLLWQLASPKWNVIVIWILLSMLSYLTAVVNGLSRALYYTVITLGWSTRNTLLMGNILTPPSAVSDL